MSEQAPLPPQDLGEAHHEQAEFDVTQKYHDTLLAAQSLDEVSTVSIQEAVDEISAIEPRVQYALPDNEGVLVLNSGLLSQDFIEKRATAYQAVVDRVATHGYLEPGTSKTYQATFSLHERSVPFEYNFGGGAVLMSAIRMRLQGGSRTEGTFLELAEKFGLEDKEVERLKYVAQTKHNVESNPRQGSNFLYHYSAPLLEIGLVDGEVKARLGVILTHEADEHDIVDFEGVYVPVEQAIGIVADGIESYAEQAETSKATADEAPKVEVLTQEILEKREASLKAFIEQFKKFAPEATVLSDEELSSLVKLAIENFHMRRDSERELGPIEKHVVDLMRDKDASFGAISNKENEVGVQKPGFSKPMSRLIANGRTGLVTRFDYEADPSHPANIGIKPSGEEVFDAEKSAELRKQMFEAKTKVLVDK